MTGIVCYSDGLVEAVDGHGELVGYDRFMEFAARACRSEGGDPLRVLFEEVRAFTGQVPWPDDATALIIVPKVGTPVSRKPEPDAGEA